MKKFPAWRYKCDFCGKNGRSSGAMKRHEEGCTANPNRICKIHRHATGEDNPAIPSVASLITILQEYKYDVDRGMKELRDAADDCPCCILAAVRQSGFCKGYVDEDGYTEPLIGKEQFDFKAELANLWSSVNDAAKESMEYY